MFALLLGLLIDTGGSGNPMYLCAGQKLIVLLLLSEEIPVEGQLNAGNPAGWIYASVHKVSQCLISLQHLISKPAMDSPSKIANFLFFSPLWRLRRSSRSNNSCCDALEVMSSRDVLLKYRCIWTITKQKEMIWGFWGLLNAPNGGIPKMIKSRWARACVRAQLEVN